MATKKKASNEMLVEPDKAQEYEGEKLKYFLVSNRISVQDFTERAGKSRGWAYDVFRQEKLSIEQRALVSHIFKNSIENILSEKTNISKNANQSMYLSSNGIMAEAAIQNLEKENKELKERVQFLEDVLKTNVRVINLQTEIIESKSHFVNS